MKCPLNDFMSMQDVRVLYTQMAGREVDEPDAPIETSLDQILAYIRSHWEKVMERNRAETDSYLECKVRMSHLDAGPGSGLAVTELSHCSCRPVLSLTQF